MNRHDRRRREAEQRRIERATGYLHRLAFADLGALRGKVARIAPRPARQQPREREQDRD